MQVTGASLALNMGKSQAHPRHILSTFTHHAGGGEGGKQEVVRSVVILY